MNEKQTGIVLIDAPSGFGKTHYIQSLGATPANTLTSEQLTDHIVQTVSTRRSWVEAAETLRHIRFVENMESLGGREATQKVAAQLVALLAQEHRIILTGIDFRKSLPFFLQALHTYQHLYLSQDGTLSQTPGAM